MKQKAAGSAERLHSAAQAQGGGSECWGDEGVSMDMDLHNPASSPAKLKFLVPCQAGTVPWLCPGGAQGWPRVQSLRAGWGRAWCHPALARTHSTAHSGPAHAASTKIKLNYWPPTHLEQNFCPFQQFKVL